MIYTYRGKKKPNIKVNDNIVCVWDNNSTTKMPWKDFVRILLKKIFKTNNTFGKKHWKKMFAVNRVNKKFVKKGESRERGGG